MTEISVSILGCGWLGLPLAKSLVELNFYVNGSTTTPTKLEMLEDDNIVSFLIHPKLIDETLLDDFLNTETLVISIPPGRTDEKRDDFKLLIDVVLDKVQENKVLKKIIFISSTSVFGDTNLSVTELSLPTPETISGRLLLETEERLLKINGKQIIIVRPAGLIGPGRHPGRFFQNKSIVENGLAPVNLIHQADIISILKLLIEKPYVNGIFHAVTPHHPTKQDFYLKASIQLGNQKPVFKNELLNWKQVESTRLSEELHYSFQYPDLFLALQNCA